RQAAANLGLRQNIMMNELQQHDPEIFDAIVNEANHQHASLDLITSENITSTAVLEATGTVLTNKYAEGYHVKRNYGRCDDPHVLEALAIQRAKQLFGAEHANVQPHSGAQANMAAYLATMKPGDTLLGMNLSHG